MSFKYLPKPVSSLRVFLAAMWMILSATIVTAAAPLSQGQPAPDFTLKSNTNVNMRLGEMRGEVIMLNFWATWCGPCRQEMPELEKLYNKFKSAGFRVLAINVDTETKNTKNFLSSLNISYPVLFDNQKSVSRQYNIEAMPSSVIIDRDGKIRYIHQGFQPSYVALYEAQIRRLVQE
jgi:peroxiredoxin